MKFFSLLIIITISFTITAYSQHEGHTTPRPDTSAMERATEPRDGSDMDHNNNDHSMHADASSIPMTHAYSLNLPMNRNGSGTGWLPDASPMYGYMFHSSDWMFMFHGNLFLRYNNQDVTEKGVRGDQQFDAPNWLMLMGQNKIFKKGLFHFSIMLSADPLITGGKGYPLLFQTGETNDGKPLIDRQHPHDLFSELSISYSHAFTNDVDAFIYLGYPGEPAIGPVAFMHRPSALYNPDAPITHHWVDATHITFGVATLGLRLYDFKLEGSSFTGREPDEDRYDFDEPLFDSWSARLSYNPTENWALQVSHAYLKSPELLHPDEDVNRTTASATYSMPLKGNNHINATALWAVNKLPDHDGENAFLIEAAWRINRLILHGRYEFVEKSGEELLLDEEEFGHDAVFPVNAVTLGFNYDLLNFWDTRLAAGAQGTLFHADEKLDVLYGANPMSVEVYLRIYPGLMK